MKKISTFFLTVILFSCGTKKPAAADEFQLYEILKEDQYNGAKIKFYEIISEPNEFRLLQNDPDLKKSVQAEDIVHANFIVINLGEKTTGGYAIKVKNIEETDESIVVTIAEEAPRGMTTTVMTYPMMVIKINSKKPIIFN